MTNRGWRERLRAWSTTLAEQFWQSEAAVMATMGLVVGVTTALGAVALITILRVVATQAQAVLAGEPMLALALPALGGLLAGLVLYAGARGKTGFDVSDILAGLSANHAIVDPLLAASKVAASVFTIGFGGSAGREGPIIHIGAAIGSAVGRRLQLNSRRVRALVAAGAAGGIAATLNAPLGGVMFAIEVLVGDFSLPGFGALIVSAAGAAAVSRAFLGTAPAFAAPVVDSPSLWEIIVSPGLGVAAALAAWLLARLLSAIEETTTSSRAPLWLRPALGGIAVGLLGYILPQTLGFSFLPVAEILHGDVGFSLLLGLLLGKVLSTSFTLGSGGAGGIFGPAIFIGAALGMAYGQALQPTIPALSSTALAMAGMAALIAATAHAPVTAVLLIFEMTQDYRLLPATIVASVIAAYGVRAMGASSVFSAQLRRRGIEARPRIDTNLMRTISAGDAMTPCEHLQSVTPTLSLDDLACKFQDSGHHGFVVLDEQGKLFGIVTLADLERMMNAGQANATVAAAATRRVVTIFPDESLDDALRQIAALDVGRLPVVERTNPRHVIGMVRRSDIVRAYSRALAQSPEDTEQTEHARLQTALGAELAEIVLTKEDSAAGKHLREIGLPSDCVVISIHRRGQVVVPRGDTRLMAGDRVIILKVSTSLDTLRAILRQGTSPQEKA